MFDLPQMIFNLLPYVSVTAAKCTVCRNCLPQNFLKSILTNKAIVLYNLWEVSYRKLPHK